MSEKNTVATELDENKTLVSQVEEQKPPQTGYKDPGAYVSSASLQGRSLGLHMV
jgi:hypothetical protein